MGELRFPIDASTVIDCDNESAIYITDNLVAHSKMKLIELHANYMRQLVQENIVTLFYCKTNDNLVDIFMKPLLEAKFVKFYDFPGI